MPDPVRPLTPVVRTYLYFWLVIPAAFLGPIGASIAWDGDASNDDAELWGMLVAAALTLLLLGLLFLYRTFWRPVREARWVSAPSSSPDVPWLGPHYWRTAAGATNETIARELRVSVRPVQQ
ncbi:hypothetical protein [Streptomyces sp. DH37]|uniref:hypothetical protein n=1 Tax=Streptomyces sp. DH37 TaxID=3040122 RepID=UPI0024428456|nr:hypothetical protein [Streptomyces sp. DH37]MDG9702904.1 hypothetical protein [Streptomyces sp. DH37]